MSIIIKDFASILAFLNGSEFNENKTIHYGAGGKVRHRTDVLVDMCRGKRVLHIGCCDHGPLIQQKIDNHDWLHGLITECSEYTVGIDIDAASVTKAREASGLTNIHVGNITSRDPIEPINGLMFDIALFGEVLEHIPDPAAFLTRFRETYGSQFKTIVITVPNAFRGGNIKGVFKNSETINTDHRFFFTPYTIAKIALDAGFRPSSIAMATFTPASTLKSFILQRTPLLAEDIIYTGTHRAD